MKGRSCKRVEDQVNNPDDLRKTVKNGKNKRKKANKKALTRLLLLIVVIVVIVMVAKNISKNKKIKLEEVTRKYNYFSTLIGENAGVMDKTGKTVTEPQYDSVQIPNPSKAIFICMNKDGTTKVLNANNKRRFNKIQKCTSHSKQ